MKRAGVGWAAAGLLATLAAGPARADCAAEVQAMRQRLPTIQDQRQRQEVSLLLDKAEKDAKAGREQLCLDALVRAQAITK